MYSCILSCFQISGHGQFENIHGDNNGNACFCQEVKAFFDRIDQSLLDGVSKSDLAIFEKVLGQLQENVEKIGGENEEISKTN